MDPGKGLEWCVKNLLEVFERSSRVLEESQWFPSDPESTRWWGGVETPLEIIVTAILVKLSRWKTALTALENMRRRGLLDLSRLSRSSIDEIAEAIRGVGFARSKAWTIIAISRYIESIGGVEALKDMDTAIARRELLRIDGIGRETADSILLFALNKPVFPVTRLSLRVLKRYCGENADDYRNVGERVEDALERDLYKLKLLHAGLTSIASRYCRNNKPLCGSCLLGDGCLYRSSGQAGQ
ncbi:DNA repair protein [Desulfurococcaceae archaeon AG1]|jgi:endonuclease-3 related protein|nr:MAG: hypothetical protein DJ555_06830 [Desulfurococcaceae archaeon]GAY25147.1 DNA repair protein [Desulfurococcaceae archaeon AG1]